MLTRLARCTRIRCFASSSAASTSSGDAPPKSTPTAIGRSGGNRQMLGTRKAEIRKTMRELGAATTSRGVAVSEIQKRLSAYERDQRAEVSTTPSEYAIESIMAENLLREQKDRYQSVFRRREVEARQRAEASKRDAEAALSSGADVSSQFPLAGVAVEKVEESELKNGTESKNSVDVRSEPYDSGFYVEANTFIDEYVAGSTADLPEDELTAPSRMYFGDDDAVEHIDFQMPGQSIYEKEHGTEGGADEDDVRSLEQFGSVDPSRAASKKSCDGCGAHIHCKDASLPGFLPVEIFDKVERKRRNSEERSILCKRCHLLKHHNFLLNVNVCPVDYAAMMSHLRLKQEALLVLIVDVTDLPASIHRQLPNIVGEHKPMIVVGNKVDLLPPDARRGFLKRFKETVERTIDEVGFRDRFNILHVGLASAKTGYGVEQLITEIHLKWTNAKYGMRSDIYLVGCTNAGKSTLFNALLQSDLCKVRAVDLVERATTSIWPGTTISLLKFPVMKPSAYRLELRRRRLLANRAWEKKELHAKKVLLEETGDSQYAVLTGTIQNTYKEQEDELQPVPLRDILDETGQVAVEMKSDKKRWSLDDPIFANGVWCYDTPGTVNDSQLLNLFTLDELVKVVPKRMLRPRTALVNVDSTLLIGGVARIDVTSLQRERGVYLTVFASDDLPLNVIATSEVDRFYKQYLGSNALAVPIGGADRMKDWPAMEPQEFTVPGCGIQIGACDIALSSIGWVMVSSRDPAAKLMAWTPAGRGMSQRQPMLPYSITQRGRRTPGTAFYKVNPIVFPDSDEVIAKRQRNSRYKNHRNQQQIE